MDSSMTQATAFHRRTEDGRLISWKGIAAYMKVSVATAQRWEKQEQLPVHRHMHARKGSVYAYAREIEAWLPRREAPADDQATWQLRSPSAP